MILANEAVGAAPRRPASGRRSSASTSVPIRRPWSSCSRSSPISRCRRRPSPEHAEPARRRARSRPRSAERVIADYAAQAGPRAARRSRRSSCARSSRRATTRRTSATRASRAAPTATSPRRSAGIPTSSSTARCCGSSASARRAGPADDLRELAEQTSERERDGRADRVPRGRALPRVAARAAALRARLGRIVFAGEIVGRIGSGIFVRFDDVFEGYLPARRLPGDYFELNPLGTALVGRGAAAPTGSATRSRCGSRRSEDRGQGRAGPSGVTKEKIALCTKDLFGLLARRGHHP